MNRVARMISNFAILFFPIASFASNCLRPNSQMESYRDLIHQAAVIDENGRRTEEEYAAEKSLPVEAVQRRFAATGKLKCSGIEMTAQLTGANDVITTAGHAFSDIKTCAKVSSPESCSFTVKTGNSIQVSQVTRLADTGFRCPKKPEGGDDWAVLKINPPIKDVTPYGLPEQLEIKEGQDVISVSAGARDFTRINPQTNKKFMPKTIEECKTKHIYGISRATLVESNCDSAQGHSGGSLLKSENGRDVLIGVFRGNNETEEQIRYAERTGRPNAGPYKEDAWTSFTVPLNHNFLKAVEAATDGRSI